MNDEKVLETRFRIVETTASPEALGVIPLSWLTVTLSLSSLQAFPLRGDGAGDGLLRWSRVHPCGVHGLEEGRAVHDFRPRADRGVRVGLLSHDDHARDGAFGNAHRERAWHIHDYFCHHRGRSRCDRPEARLPASNDHKIFASVMFLLVGMQIMTGSEVLKTLS